MSNIFETSANQSQLGFEGPMNPANMNRGWGIDSSYLTPSYTAPFRPQLYDGNNAFHGSASPGMFSAAKHSLFGHTPHGISEGDTSQYYSGAASKPIDYGLGLAQTLAIPMAATWAAYKLNSSFTVSRTYGKGAAEWFSTNVSSTIAGIGKTAAEKEAIIARGMQAAGRTTLISRGASSFVGGATKGLLNGMGRAAGLGALGSTAAGGMMAGGAATLAGAAASLFIPGAIASGVVSLADNLIFDQYTAQRQLAGNLRSNFQNRMVGSRNVSSPLGISSRDAQRIASTLQRSASHDREFSFDDYGEIADSAAKLGLLGSSNVDNMASKIEKIVKTTSAIMRLGKVIDKNKALAIFEDLKSSGVTSNSSITSIASNAAIAGVGLERFMNTIGNQSRYSAQQMGMLGGAGIHLGSRSMATFEMAKRSGLMSDQLAALMGGVEGAAQSYTSGTLAAARSPYMNMALQNKYFGGGMANSVVGNITKFGAMAAGDVFGAYGASVLHGGTLASAEVTQGSRNPALVQAMQMGDAMHLRKNGKFTPETLASLMTSMGQTPDQIRAILEHERSLQDRDTANTTIANSKAQFQSNVVDAAKLNGYNYGVFQGTADITSGAWRDTKGFFNKKLVSPTSRAASGMEDWWAETFSSTNMMGFKENSKKHINMLNTEGDVLDNSYLATGLKFASTGVALATSLLSADVRDEDFLVNGIDKKTKEGREVFNARGMRFLNTIATDKGLHGQQASGLAQKYIDKLAYIKEKGLTGKDLDSARGELKSTLSELYKTGGLPQGSIGLLDKEFLEASIKSGTVLSKDKYTTYTPYSDKIGNIEEFGKGFARDVGLTGSDKTSIGQSASILTLASQIRSYSEAGQAVPEELLKQYQANFPSLKDKNPEEVKKDAETRFKRSDTRTAIIANVITKLTGTGMGATEAAKAAVEVANGAANMPRNIPEGRGGRHAAAFINSISESGAETASTTARLNEALSRGDINFDTYQSSTAASVLKDAANTFKESVSAFNLGVVATAFKGDDYGDRAKEQLKTMLDSGTTQSPGLT